MRGYQWLRLVRNGSYFTKNTKTSERRVTLSFKDLKFNQTSNLLYYVIDYILINTVSTL